MICENCGKEHDGSYGSGRFCCKECARSFSTKNEINKLKEANCIECGKKIYVNKRASLNKCRCKDCIKPNIKCNVCGLYYKKGSGGCKNEFCKKHNLQQINTLVKYFGFDKTKIGTLEVEQEFNRVRNYLYDLYWNKNLSSTQLAKMFNYKSSSTNITQKFFKEYLNIPVKSLKYSINENYLEGRNKLGEIHNQYKSNWHTTWNGKEVYLRSSYEDDYAKELDEKQIDYDVEALRIKYFDTQQNEYRCAIPDFYIPNENLIVEIKSEWTLNIQEMKDKKKAYLDQGYNFKFILEHKEVDLDNMGA